MNINEKRKAIQEYCDRFAPIYDCVGCVFRENCISPHMTVFDEAPEEMIHKWHAMAFPEPANTCDDEQRTFSTGAVRDNATGKGRFDLLPWGAIWEVAKHSQRGADHYGSHNVDKGIPTSVLLDSGIRHVCRHLCGDTDEPHLVAAAWNLLWAVQMCITHPELVDTPWKEDGEREA